VRARVHFLTDAIVAVAAFLFATSCAPEPPAPAASVAAPLTVGGCQCPAWSSGVACEALSYSDVPADGTYHVTTFGGPGDGQDMWVCGHKTTDNGSWAYMAGHARFGCAKVRVEDPASGRSCVAEVADCGPNRCVEEAASFSSCASHVPILDVSPFVTQHLFGISSSGWSEKRVVRAEVVAPATPIGCPGGDPPDPDPDLSIAIRFVEVPGQIPDFRPEGPSAGVFDLYEGQAARVEIAVRNAAGAGATAGAVLVGYGLSSPWIAPVPGTPLAGTIDLGPLGPGEERTVVVEVRAASYSIGVPSPPVARAWVRSVPGYYEEQASWDDPVEHNDAGSLLRAEVPVDVWSRTRWEFEGSEDQTEGWAPGASVAPLRVFGGALVIQATGPDPAVLGPATRIDAAAAGAVLLRSRALGGDAGARLLFETELEPGFAPERSVAFTLPGDGTFHDVEVPVAAVPGWTGTVTRLRIDPGTGWSAFDRIAAIPAGTPPDQPPESVPVPEPVPDSMLDPVPVPEPEPDSPPVPEPRPEPAADPSPGLTADDSITPPRSSPGGCAALPSGESVLVSILVIGALAARSVRRPRLAPADVHDAPPNRIIEPWEDLP